MVCGQMDVWLSRDGTSGTGRPHHGLSCTLVFIIVTEPLLCSGTAVFTGESDIRAPHQAPSKLCIHGLTYFESSMNGSSSDCSYVIFTPSSRTTTSSDINEKSSSSSCTVISTTTDCCDPRRTLTFSSSAPDARS